MVPAFAFIREKPSYREGSEQYNRLSGSIVLIFATMLKISCGDLRPAG